MAKEVAKEETKHKQEVKEYQDKVDALQQQYLDLQDEFRVALTVEARRFNEVRVGVRPRGAVSSAHSGVPAPRVLAVTGLGPHLSRAVAGSAAG